MDKWRIDNTVDAIVVNDALGYKPTGLGKITTNGWLMAIGTAVFVLGLGFGTAKAIKFARPAPAFAIADEHGVTRELPVFYHGKPVRMLADNEQPMDDDGEIISPASQPVTASADTVSTE